MPCEGGEAVMLTSETRLNNIAVLVSTPILKNLCHIAQAAHPIDFYGFFVRCGMWIGAKPQKNFQKEFATRLPALPCEDPRRAVLTAFCRRIVWRDPWKSS